MTALPVTSVTALILGTLLLGLTWLVIAKRRGDGIVLGDEGDRVMLKRIRAHGNAAEQVPIALIVMALAEMNGSPAALLWPLALLLIAGRASHAAYFARHGLHWRFRVFGMLLTLIAQTGLLLALLIALL